MLRTRTVYPRGWEGDVQVSSASASAAESDWSTRTDCAAFVMDFVRDEDTVVGDTHSGNSAFVNGTIDHALLNSMDRDEVCPLAYVSKKIVAHVSGSASGNWQTVYDADTDSGCNWEPIWFGSLYPVTRPTAWFSALENVRVITQGFINAFPVAVEAYIQTGPDEGCPFKDECCYAGDELTECS